MLLTIEKILILKSVNIFSSVPEAQLTDIATIAESVEYSAGESIIRRGELGKSMYIVARGKVKITDGTRELGIWRARCFRPRTANVKALED